MADLLDIGQQKAALDRNTLLRGSRGTGKSSLVKALLTEYSSQGLRLAEVSRRHLIELADIQELPHDRPERFILEKAVGQESTG
jgi:predicted AAA+ superfamily ATPase